MDHKVLSRFQLFSSFQLKMIAIITMLIDHIGAILFPQQLVLRYIGRISFPIFCFLLVEGFYHTRNIKKYLLRLAVFAIVSEIPFDLAFRHVLFDTYKQNVFLTLTIGLLMLYGISQTNVIIEQAIILFLALSFGEILACDYGYEGILLIFAYYIFREKRLLAVFAGASWNLLWYKVIRIQIYGVFAAIPLFFYNGKPGRKMKYVFYVFYPLHLIVLYTIRRIYF